jgi:hypothetical protein
VGVWLNEVTNFKKHLVDQVGEMLDKDRDVDDYTIVINFRNKLIEIPMNPESYYHLLELFDTEIAKCQGDDY